MTEDIAYAHDGLYEQLINKKLDQKLSETDKFSLTVSIDPAEVARVIAKYTSKLLVG